MNQHFTPPPSTILDDDAATKLQDDIYSAKMMAEIAITLVCETFDGPANRPDHRVSRRKADMIMFASSDTARRLQSLDDDFEKLILGQP